MSKALKIAMAQTNPTVGELNVNAARIKAQWKEAKKQNADLVVTAEQSITGYPLDDLIFREGLVKATEKVVRQLAAETKDGPPLLVGAPWVKDGVLYNAAILLEGGEVKRVIPKRKLPHYGPFHEKRYYEAGNDYDPIEVKGQKVGVAICEDIWDIETAERLKENGAESIVVLNASPYETEKRNQRLNVVRKAAKETGLPIVYTNLVGGQDELVFDGASFAVDGRGEMIAAQPAWEEGVELVRVGGAANYAPAPANPWAQDPYESDYEALVMSVRDYARKNDFKTAIIGISGGIDSAVTTAIACDALGPENVHGLMLAHDRYTSGDSLEFSRGTCEMSGCHFSADHYITGPYEAMMSELGKRWKKTKVKETGENVQARLRTLFLFAVSNEEDQLVLNTSNKSEVAMGHSTFYGDTSGGFAPLKDMWKLRVYAIAKWRNENMCKIGLGKAGPVVHNGIIEREPTPELGENETDKDLLPPYEVLDPILQALVEDELSIPEIAAQGFEAETVAQIAYHLKKMQFKRFQTPPGPKVSPKSFGHRERMYPITNKYFPRVYEM